MRKTTVARGSKGTQPHPGRMFVSYVLLDTLGLYNVLLRTMFVVWLSSSLSLTLLALTGTVRVPPERIALYIAGTFLSSVLLSFTATCLGGGNCERTALLVALSGFMLIALGYLFLH